MGGFAFLRHVGGDRNFAALAVAVGMVGVGLHSDQVDYAAELFFRADGKMDGDRGAAQDGLDTLQSSLKAGTFAIEAVDDYGAGQLELPENEMHTTSYWITLERALLESLPYTISERQSGMFGLLYGLASVATLLLMCDGRDLGTAIGERPPAPGMESEEFTPMRMQEAVGTQAKEFFEPNLYLFDAYPGGIGFSEPLFRAHELLVRKARELIQGCPCDAGCPSCVGPAGDLAPKAKEAALAILNRLCS